MNFSKLSLALLATAITVHSAASLSAGVGGAGTSQSAIPLEHKEIVVDAGLSYYPGSNLGLRDSAGREVESKGAERFDMAASIQYGLFPFFEVGVLVPYYLDMDLSGKEFRGLGDVRTSFKLNYPPYPHKKGFDISLLAQIDWPTATDAGEQGGYTRHSWYTVSGSNEDSTRNAFGALGPTFTARMLTTANLGAIEGFLPVLLHMNWGASFTGASSQNSFLIGGGAEVAPYPLLSLFWSFNSEISISQAARNIPIMDYPFASSAGLQFNFPKAHLDVYGGLHWVINDIPDTLYSAPMDAPNGSPDYSRFPTWGWFGGLALRFGFVPSDTDGDGIYDHVDQCPAEKEDVDNYQDNDGCPEWDNDGDGIVDLKDKCPIKAEDKDSFEDEDGCPELDNDGDSVADLQDKCPLAPEDKDGFQDDDGCPEIDNDSDGIPDAKDQCQGKMEDVDTFQDEDGCPEWDNDNDGVPDTLDRCPLQAEVVNGVEDGDGCPDTRPQLPAGAKVAK